MFLKPENSAIGAPLAPRRRHWKPALSILAVLVVFGTLVGFRATQAPKVDGPSVANVVLEFAPADVAVVEVRALERSIPFSGSLSPLVQTTVKSKVSGDVNKVHVREGEAVAAGQLMAQIDTADLQARLDAQVAALEEARARLTLADKNRENNLQLLRQKFISQNAFDTTQSTSEASAAFVRAAEAQVRLAKTALEDAAVRAPFGGIVAKKMVNAGEKVGIDSALFGLVDLARMEIEAPAPASEIPAVHAGQAVSFRVDGFGARVFNGRVERINPAAEPGSRSITLYISVANGDGALRGGMFAKGRIVLDRTQPSTVIPASAVRDEAGQAYVFTIEDGKIGKRAVKVGLTEPSEGVVEVKSGLEEGLNVVSARMSGLKPGAAAIMKPASSAAAGAKAG
ncbi:MAG: efflux RND transporter periplasmic adaptor subunit [Usitatibacter sp.]